MCLPGAYSFNSGLTVESRFAAVHCGIRVKFDGVNLQRVEFYDFDARKKKKSLSLHK